MDRQSIDYFKNIPGAISVTEAIALYRIIVTNLDSSRLFKEAFIDFGSYMGKSSFVAITALSYLNLSGEFLMIEPAYRYGRRAIPYFTSDSCFEEVKSSVSKFINADIKVTLHPLTSEEFVAKRLPSDISYAFVDTGEHSKESIKIETDYLDSRMVKGGIIVFHDFGNQYTAPAEAANELVATGRYRKIEIDWEPIFEIVNKDKLEEENNSWHWTDHPHPNFIRAIRRLNT